MGILGLRDTSNFVANQRPENWRETIALFYPNGKMPLTALTGLMKEKSTDDPVFHWWEKELDDRRVVLSGNIDATQTSIPVTGGATIVKLGDLLMAEHTKEIMRVAQDPITDLAIVVTRGAANTTGTAITYNAATVNPNLVVIGSAFEEGSLAPTGVNYDPSDAFNYTQIFRSTLEITRTAEKTRLRTGDAVKEAKRECLEYFGIDMERAFWFGKRYATVHNGKPLRYTNGVYQYILANAPAANVHNFTAAIDMEELETMLEVVFRKGSNEKLAIGGNRALLTAQQIIRKNSSWNIQSGIKEFGMDVSRITTPFGEIVMKTHPLFNQMAGGVNAGAEAYVGMNSTMAILDMKEFTYRYITDIKYEKDLQETGLDGMKAGYLAECGIEMHHAESHHWWTNLSLAAADA